MLEASVIKINLCGTMLAVTLTELKASQHKAQ